MAPHGGSAFSQNLTLSALLKPHVGHGVVWVMRGDTTTFPGPPFCSSPQGGSLFKQNFVPAGLLCPQAWQLLMCLQEILRDWERKDSSALFFPFYREPKQGTERQCVCGRPYCYSWLPCTSVSAGWRDCLLCWLHAFERNAKRQTPNHLFSLGIELPESMALVFLCAYSPLTTL